VTPPNLDLSRSIYAEWESGDFSSSDWAHPDIEFVSADGPVAGAWSGLPQMAAAMRDWLTGWADWRVRAEEHRELAADRVLVLFTFNARGRSSGVEIDEEWSRGATVFQFADGKVVRLVQYLDRARALAELGLETDP
jgi:ketosteroid isomerase-like protein